MISSATLPVLLEVDVPFQLMAVLTYAKAAVVVNLDDARRRRVAGLVGHADHLRVAAQVDMRVRRIERLAQAFLELPAGDQVLDIDLVPDRVGLARRQAEIRV